MAADAPSDSMLRVTWVTRSGSHCKMLSSPLPARAQQHRLGLKAAVFPFFFFSSLKLQWESPGCPRQAEIQLCI